MTKNDLIKKVSDFNTQIEELIQPQIEEIIGDKKNKLIEINNILEIKGSVGFYMIFCSNKIPGAKYCLTENKTKYYCVYRGHSYNMKNRLISHLFYEPNGAYKNCMQIDINNKKYNINIETETLYANKSTINKDYYPKKWKWAYVSIPLTNSKQAFREMFETTFDKKYKHRPPFNYR